jgi:hypothetical protein
LIDTSTVAHCNRHIEFKKWCDDCKALQKPLIFDVDRDDWKYEDQYRPKKGGGAEPTP